MNSPANSSPRPVLLVIGYGNTLRGDDGVGPRVADAVEALMKRIGQPTRLSELVAGERIMQHFEQIVVGTMSDPSTMFNPRPVIDPAAVAEFIQSTI